MRSTILWSLLITGVFFAACDNKTEEKPTPNNQNNNDTTTIELCDTLDATYIGKVSAVLNTNCAVSGCHTGVAPAAGINLSTYEDAKFIAEKPAFLGAVKHETGFKPMPFQKPKLEQQYIDILECWVTNGFPES